MSILNRLPIIGKFFGDSSEELTPRAIDKERARGLLQTKIDNLYTPRVQNGSGGFMIGFEYGHYLTSNQELKDWTFEQFKTLAANDGYTVKWDESHLGSPTLAFVKTSPAAA